MAGVPTPPLVQVLVWLAKSWRLSRIRLKRLSDAGVDDDRREEAENTYHLHPFHDFVARVVSLTGLEKHHLCVAAEAGFEGQPAMVRALRDLDGSQPLNQLYAELIRQHPVIAERCGLQNQLPNSVQPGRKKSSISRHAQPIDADNQKKIPQKQPVNKQVRDLCKLLDENRTQLEAGTKSEIGVAREFTREPVGSCPKADNLLRQARRYPHLWKQN